jgi:general secretion pathway protein G
MTLIEIMIVVVIMALVATGVGMAVIPMLREAKIRQTQTAVESVRSAVTMYVAVQGECPTMSDLIARKVIDSGKATTDAWNHEFQIVCEGTEISVRSAGPDGQLDTEDDIPKRS